MGMLHLAAGGHLTGIFTTSNVIAFLLGALAALFAMAYISKG